MFNYLSIRVVKPVEEIRLAVKDFQNFSSKTLSDSSQNFYSFDTFIEDSGYDFPITTDEDFNLFNTHIAKNARNIKLNLVKLFVR